MEVRLDDLINRVKSKSYISDEPTFKRLKGNTEKFSISHNKLNTFYKEYSKIVTDAENMKNPGISLAECSNDNTSNLSLTAKFMYSDSSEQIEINDIFVFTVMEKIQQCIIKSFYLGQEREEEIMICVYSESDEWKDSEGILYKKINFHYPLIRMTIKEQKDILYPNLIKSLTDCRILTELDQKPLNSIQSLFEEPKSYRGMYLSTISDDRPLIFKNIYGPIDNPNEFKLDVDCLEDYDDIFNKNDYYIDDLINYLVDDEDPNYIPILYSNGFVTKNIIKSKKHRKKEDKLETPSKTLENYKMDEDEDTIDLISDKIPINMAYKFLPMISEDKFNNHFFWKIIGEVLFNLTDDDTSEGQNLGLHLWIEYTNKKSNVFTKRDCIKEYDKMSLSRYGVGTLGRFAREDSPQSYKDWHDKWCEPAFIESLSGTDATVSEAIYRTFWLDYACGDLNKIYKFHKHQLLHVNDNLHLREDIITHLVRRYKGYIKRLEGGTTTGSVSSKATKSDIIEKKYNETYIKAIKEIIKKLESWNFQTSVIKMCRIKFRILKFESYLNSDPYLLGVDNGILHFSSKGVLFRPGLLEDFVTLSTGTKYIEKYDRQHDHVKFVDDFFKKVFVNREEREYFCLKTSTYFVRINKHKKIDVYTGKRGNNGKSVTTKAIKAMLGRSYAVDAPSDLFVGKKASNGPNPAIAQLKDACFVTIADLDSDITLQNGIIKALSGNDGLFARNCNENGGGMDFGGHISIHTNGMPHVENIDAAGKGRLDQIDFSSFFDYDAPESIEEQFKNKHFLRDDEVEEMLKIRGNAILWYFVEYYKQYAKQGCKIKAPDSVIKLNTEYWKEHDDYVRFIDEKLIRVEDDEGNLDINSRITWTDIQPVFAKWWMINKPNAKKYDISRIKDKFCELDKLGQQNIIAHHWVGWKIREEGEVEQQPQNKIKKELRNNKYNVEDEIINNKPKEKKMLFKKKNNYESDDENENIGLKHGAVLVQ